MLKLLKKFNLITLHDYPAIYCHAQLSHAYCPAAAVA
jgi:hypothetical protein